MTFVGKFQVLAREARFSGVVTRASGSDFDLALDACFWKLRLAFPLFPVLHCETYGYGDLPAGVGDPAVSVGQRVAVSGALALDSYVHASEATEHPERVAQRGLFRAFRPKLELHPYQPGSVVIGPPPLVLERRTVSYFEEAYSPDWIWNRLWRRAGAGVGQAVSAEIEVGNTAQGAMP